MIRLVHRRGVLHAGLALGASLVVPSARACEFFTTTLRVTHPWTRASAAAAGDSAIVCMVFDEVATTDRLIGVSSPIAARAEMGGAGFGAAAGAAGTGSAIDFTIPQGLETAFTERGTFVRLVGLTQPLQLARTYPLTLVFEKGGTVEADLTIDHTAYD